MDDLTKIVSARLTEVFKNESQYAIAEKLNTTQSNISKYVKGKQLPPADTLNEIAKAYKVSVDWILGISDCKEIDGVSVEKLTYEQIGRVIDYLFAINTIEVPITKRKNSESKVDSDNLKIKDRVLSHILRRRLIMYNVGEDYAELWRNTLSIFKGVQILKNSPAMQDAIDAKDCSTFADGDWVTAIKELSTLGEEELKISAERERARKREEKDDDRE